MSTVYEFSIPYVGNETSTAVYEWLKGAGCNHWCADYRTLPPENWPKHLGVNPPRHLYRRQMIVALFDEDIALQFKLAFSATQLDEPFHKFPL